LRVIPDALHKHNPYPQQKDWYSGAAAWDLVGSTATKLGRINHWLNDSKTLNLGYSVRLKTTTSKYFYSGGNDPLEFLSSTIDAYGDQLIATYSRGDIEEDPETVEIPLDISKLKEILSLNGVGEKKNKGLPDDVSSRHVLWDDVNNVEVSSADIGVGVSQLFPLVVAAIETQQGLVACEQPELHVHPRVQVSIGDLLLQNSKRCSFLIETHSEHLILRVLRRIRETSEGQLPEGVPSVVPSDVSIIYLEPTAGGVKARRIEVDESGEFTTRWPSGFFAERGEELF
jgi:hypothetical protein